MNEGSNSSSAGMARTLSLRHAMPGDEQAVAAVHVASWQAGYAGLLAATYLDSLRLDDRAARYTFGDRSAGRPATVVATESDQIVGFATTGPARGADCGACGELYALYVHPDWWGRRIGRALLVDARRRLTDAGVTEAMLWVLDGNQRAQRFYQADGWLRDGARRRERVHGIDIEELGYRRLLP
jgi:GNAT superfamily N-acetyltransferase